MKYLSNFVIWVILQLAKFVKTPVLILNIDDSALIFHGDGSKGMVLANMSNLDLNDEVPEDIVYISACALGHNDPDFKEYIISSFENSNPFHSEKIVKH